MNSSSYTEPDAELEPDEPPSRTKKKKAALALQKLGERLAALSEPELGRMELPAELAQALADLRQMKKHEARRRQFQYIGSLMRKIDVEDIRAELDGLALKEYEAVHRFKQIEQWRDALLAGDDTCLNDLLEKFPALERQQLTQLARNARKEAERQKPPKAARKLFRYLKEST